MKLLGTGLLWDTRHAFRLLTALHSGTRFQTLKHAEKQPWLKRGISALSELQGRLWGFSSVMYGWEAGTIVSCWRECPGRLSAWQEGQAALAGRGPGCADNLKRRAPWDSGGQSAISRSRSPLPQLELQRREGAGDLERGEGERREESHLTGLNRFM